MLRVVSTCQDCGRRIWGARADARYCSSACKQRAYRERVALVKRYGCADLEEAADVQIVGQLDVGEFEAVLNEARAAGNLSRAKVVQLAERYASSRNAGSP